MEKDWRSGCHQTLAGVPTDPVDRSARVAEGVGDDGQLGLRHRAPTSVGSLLEVTSCRFPEDWVYILAKR